MLEMKSVRMEFPADANIIVGQAHFIKTVEDMYEAVATTAPQAKFGLAFNESSGACLTRSDGNDPTLQEIAAKNAQALASGHTFVLVLSGAYLFRDEYIFDVEKAVVVETPQLGHATYVFAKPRNMETFLTLYTKITRDDILRNRDNAAERLGFLARVIHGTNPRAWLKEVRQHVGEAVDFATALPK